MKAVVLSTLFTLGLGYEHGLELSTEDESILDMNEFEVRSMKLHVRAGGSVPATLNYGPKMNPVKNQGGCGSCWAFAAADALSARHAVKNNELIDISEKHMLDCTYPDSKDGCQGGNSDTAWRNVARKGVAGQESYHSYNARDDTCPSDSQFDANGFARKVFAGTHKEDPTVHQYFTGKQDMKEELFKYGPCVMYMGADSAFSRMGKGIWRCGSTRINHAITVVGYGRENGENYWMIKNSWGTGWGDNGFGRISMDHCQLGSATGIIFKCPEVRQVKDTLSQFTKIPSRFVHWNRCSQRTHTCPVNTYDGCKRTALDVCDGEDCAAFSILQPVVGGSNNKRYFVTYSDKDCMVSKIYYDRHWEVYVKENTLPCCPENGNGRGEGTCTPGHCWCYPRVDPGLCSTKTCQVWQCCDPSSTCRDECKVTLYEDDQFSGASKAYGLGSVPRVWRNDKVTSIKVEGRSDCKMTAYEHGDYKGWGVTLSRGFYTLTDLRTKGFVDDGMSSMKVWRDGKIARRLEDSKLNELIGFSGHHNETITDGAGPADPPFDALMDMMAEAAEE